MFVPQRGNRVTWYNCGPTVYDASHMGHARTYLTFDILRRVMRDYFGYDVFYVMNITDVDDKIIKRARQNHLYDAYVSENPPLEKILVDANNVLKVLYSNFICTTQYLFLSPPTNLSLSRFQSFCETMKKTTDPDKRKMQEGQIAKLTDAVTDVEASVQSGSKEQAEAARRQLLSVARDLLSDWLDKEKGAEVKDNAIFASLPKYWEEEFHKDMEALNVSFVLTVPIKGGKCF